jgi:hypothetical protein
MISPSRKKLIQPTRDVNFWFGLMNGYGLTPEQMDCLRAMLRFRTSGIIDRPDPMFQGLWDRLTFLDIGAAYPNQSFTGWIPNSSPVEDSAEHEMY